MHDSFDDMHFCYSLLLFTTSLLVMMMIIQWHSYRGGGNAIFSGASWVMQSLSIASRATGDYCEFGTLMILLHVVCILIMERGIVFVRQVKTIK